MYVSVPAPVWRTLVLKGLLVSDRVCSVCREVVTEAEAAMERVTAAATGATREAGATKDGATRDGATRAVSSSSRQCL